MLNNGLQVDKKCTQMTLGISMLKNIIILHIKLLTHNTWQFIHSKLRSVTPAATKVHMTLHNFVVLT